MKRTVPLLVALVLIAGLTLVGYRFYHRHVHHGPAVYERKEVYITMRDGVKLYTIIYQKPDTAARPIMFIRTPYSADNFWIANLAAYMKEGYIIVVQDVRGKFMSEGVYEDIRPYIADKQGKQTDEASDTYDAIDWLVKNIKGNNGRVGMTGISYPGFYAAIGGLCGHPALKAISPQAPICDWFAGDDIHHNGAFFMMDAVNLFHSFGKYRPRLTKEYPPGISFPDTNSYAWYMHIGTLQNLAKLMGDSIQFWKDVYAHPDYDAWWQQRDVRSYIQHIPPQVATLVVGGMFDAEDCYGALNVYKGIEQKTTCNNKLVMGPWAHGAWADTAYDHLGNIRFGQKVSQWYLQHVEAPFFNYYLMGKGSADSIAEATMFFTGVNKWRTYAQWPPKDKEDITLYLHTDGTASGHAPVEPDAKGFFEYTSDPVHPVPSNDSKKFRRSVEYMDDDQRFAAHRADVAVYQTAPLSDDVTFAGPIVADLFTSISTTDADFVVKVIDVFPADCSYGDSTDSNNTMGGYQMLVRAEVMRGRYRNSLSTPEAFTPGQVTEVKFTLPDVAHVFREGHRIMIQVQSSWFPLIDRNPQQFIDIYHCREKDFIPAQVRIYSSATHPSRIIMPVVD